MAGVPNPRSFGNVKLKGGRYYPTFMAHGTRHSSGRSFTRKLDAEKWLRSEEQRLAEPDWVPPQQFAAVTQARLEAEALKAAEHPFTEVATNYMRHRTYGPKPLKPRTLEHYEKLLDDFLLPVFGTTPVKQLDVMAVEAWYYEQRQQGRPTYLAHAYSLLSTIMKHAMSKGLVQVNPCQIVGASNSKVEHEIRPATKEELATLVGAMPERYRLMVLLAAWCGLRFGELAELRRSDVDLEAGALVVKRGVTLVKGEHVVGDPKSRAGVRVVFIPPHLHDAVRAHLTANMNGRDGLLFPARDGSSTLRPSTLYRVFYPARDKAGRPDLRFHDLRHTAATMYAEEGATLAELQAVLGHSTVNAAMRYQHASTDRLEELARRASKRAAQS
jgi:integrase